MMEKTKVVNNYVGQSSNAFYGIGMVGALVYFWQHSSPLFGDKLMAILKAIVWPAILAYKLFGFLG